MDRLDLDLNLLRVLDALLEARSVTGAAERLHLSPSAVSRSLARLRRATGDPLMVTAGRSSVLTPHAEALHEPVREALHLALAALSPPGSVDVTTLKQRVVIAADEAVATALAPALVARLAEQAPGIELSFVTDRDAATELRAGRLDVHVGVLTDPPGDLRAEELFVDRFVAAMRRDHPLAGRRLTLPRYTEAHHVVVSPRGATWGPVDEALAAGSRARRRITSVGGFVTALWIAASTDAVAQVPSAVVIAVAGRLDVVARPIPLELPPVPVALTWHQRNDVDPAHRWLREVISDVAVDAAP